MITRVIRLGRAGPESLGDIRIMMQKVIRLMIATGEYLETGNIMMINNFAKDEGSEFNV